MKRHCLKKLNLEEGQISEESQLFRDKSDTLLSYIMISIVLDVFGLVYLALSSFSSDTSPMALQMVQLHVHVSNALMTFHACFVCYNLLLVLDLFKSPMSSTGSRGKKEDLLK